MAIALVQKKGAQTAASVASLAVTLDAPPTAGNLLVACCNSDATVATPTGFTLAVSAVQNQGLYIFYRVAQLGDSATVTFVPSVSDSVAGGVLEYSGWSAPVLDKTASNTTPFGTGTLATGTTGTTTAADELVIVAVGPHAPAIGTSFTLSGLTGGYTTQVSEPQALGAAPANDCALFVGDLIVSATGTYGSTATWTPDGDAGAAVATFKGAGGALPLAADALAASSGTANIVVPRALVAAGVASSAGGADIVVQRVLAAQGMASSSGSASLAVQAVLAATGKASSAGAASLNLNIALAAAGMASSSGQALFPAAGPPYIPGPTAARRIA